jgi:2'-5' RNA ligase
MKLDKTQFLVNKFRLYKSDLTSIGPVYEAVKEFGK